MNLQFTFASIYNAPELVKLVNSAYRGESSKRGWTTEADLLEGQRIDYDELVKIIETEGSSILMASNETQEIIACCELKIVPASYFYPSTVPSKNLYFGMFTVKPEMQNQGIGRQFLEKIIEYGQKWNLKLAQMTVITQRTELIAYYERQGFHRKSVTVPFPEDPRFGIPKVKNLVMQLFEKELTPTRSPS